MPKFIYGQSTYGIKVPAGKYVCQFLGTEDRDPFKDSKFGNKDTPRMAWIFLVRQGPFAGERIEQVTGTVAGPKTGAARILLGLASGNAETGESLDTDNYLNKLYWVKVSKNPDSEKGNLYVSDLEPYQGKLDDSTPLPPASRHAPALPPAAPERSPVPPPKRNSVAAEERFWFQPPNLDADPTLETRKDIQDSIDINQLNPEELYLCKEGAQDWLRANQLGFTRKIVF